MSCKKYELHDNVLIEAEIVAIRSPHATDEISYDIYVPPAGEVIHDIYPEDIIGLSYANAGKTTEWVYHDNMPWCANCAREVRPIDATVYKYCPFCGLKVVKKGKVQLALEEESNVRPN